MLPVGGDQLSRDFKRYESMAISGGLDGEIEFHPNDMVEANSIMICQMLSLIQMLCQMICRMLMLMLDD